MHILYINLIKCLLHGNLRHNYPNSKQLGVHAQIHDQHSKLSVEFQNKYHGIWKKAIREIHQMSAMKKRSTKEKETYGFPINWSVVYLLYTMNVNTHNSLTIDGNLWRSFICLRWQMGIMIAVYLRSAVFIYLFFFFIRYCWITIATAIAAKCLQ